MSNRCSLIDCDAWQVFCHKNVVFNPDKFIGVHILLTRQIDSLLYPSCNELIFNGIFHIKPPYGITGLILRAFDQSLEERATAMLSLAENLKDYANKKEMMEHFQKKFPQKGN